MKPTDQPQQPVHGPEKRVCANEKCRRPYVPVRTALARHARGLCPKCCEAVRDGNAKRLDPELYAKCQRISAAEPHFRSGKKGKGRPGEDAEKYEARQLEALAKKPLRSPYIPSSRGGGRKVGSGRTDSSGHEGRH